MARGVDDKEGLAWLEATSRLALADAADSLISAGAAILAALVVKRITAVILR